MTLVPIIFAPAIAGFSIANQAGAMVLSVLTGIGFAAMVPVTISVAQRTLPHRTSLASSLMMGGAWMLAFLGPQGAEWCLGVMNWSLDTTFLLTAGLLAASGLACTALSSRLLQETAH